MGFSALGMVVATRAGVIRLPFTIAFVAAPTLHFITKRELDQFEVSVSSRRPFEAEMEEFAQTKQAYNIVMKESDEKI